MNHSTAESPMDRLKRSRANQEQIEQTVLEYEKTIQILESNLSSTRTLLAHTQSNLLDKETKCARTETINQQLHSRVQKLMDRESNNKTYLRDLEARLGGQTSGKEKSGAIIIELQKEIARVRESEANAEDYISTLEERLAEADQDMETIQREVERLEHVVDRQRSLGKLDDLLHELDHKPENDPRIDGLRASQRATKFTRPGHPLVSHVSLDNVKEAEETALPEGPDEDLLESPETKDEASAWIQDSDLNTLVRATAGDDCTTQTSPAQANLTTARFEGVASELFALRLEHENTTNQFHLLSAKYEEALQTLARMDDGGHRSRTSADLGLVSPELAARPSSPFEEVKSVDSEARIPLPSSRSFSSELSFADGNSSADVAETTTQSSRDVLSGDAPSQDVDKLRRMLAEHEHGMGLVTQQYAQLQAEHQQTLETVDVLKAEIQKVKVSVPPSPGQLSPVIRRATSQNLILTDRANRSLGSLRMLFAEEFEAKPSKMETAEVHLSATSHELQSRLERIQSLETEMKNAKKEMDAKMAIISGLTRERNSLKGSSPVDLSMVSQIRDQLIQNENEIRTLHENHSSREEQLLAEIEALKGSKTNRTEHTEVDDDEEQTEQVFTLGPGVDGRQAHHQAAVGSVPSSEWKSAPASDEVGASRVISDAVDTQSSEDSASASERAAVADDPEAAREKYQDIIDGLKQEVEEHKASAAGLEQGNKSLRLLMIQHKQDFDEKDRQLAYHHEQLARLEKEASERKSTLALHKDRLKSLHETNYNKIEEMKLAHAGQLAELDDQQAEGQRAHQRAIQALTRQIETSDRQVQSLLTRAGSVLGRDTSADTLHSHIEDLMKEKAHTADLYTELSRTNGKIPQQLEASRNRGSDSQASDPTISDHQAKIDSLAQEVASHEETVRSKDEMIKKRDAMIESINIEKKNSGRIIEELEQQIETSFDHHHNRLSVIQQQGNQALVEAQARIAALEKEFGNHRRGSEADVNKSAPRSQSPLADSQNRTSSMSSNLRKSASAASLPSPPPAIPLPPLPSLAALPPGANVNGLSNSNASASPPSSRHASKELPAMSNHQTQLMEDQEARIRTTEKHLNAEKQLTATLEEALVDLETQSTKLRSEMDSWKKKAWSAEEELQTLRRDKKHARESIQAVEMERDKRREAEAERARLEERMQQLSRKKKKNALSCF